MPRVVGDIVKCLQNISDFHEKLKEDQAIAQRSWIEIGYDLFKPPLKLV